MTLPYSFSAGQPAKAAEVNADFVFLKDTITQAASALQASVNSVQSSLSTVNSECVHKTGTETIAGKKTFTGQVVLSGITSVPTPEAAANNTYPTTAKWVKDFAKTSGADYMATFSKGASGYYKFTNGLIVQWGHTAVNKKDDTSITFPTAFSGANSYGLAEAFYSTVARESPQIVTSRSASGFTVNNDAGSSGGSIYCYWVAIGY